MNDTPESFLAWMSDLELPAIAPPQRIRIERTADLIRIRDAERVDWASAPELPDLARRLSALLRTPEGAQELKTGQAATLRGVFDAPLHGHRGVIVPLRTGYGKTHPGFLAAEVVKAVRPLLVVPAKMINSGKTQREHAAVAQHWKLRPLMSARDSKKRGRQEGPQPLRMISYEALGRVEYANALEAWGPDLLVLDEAHKLRHTNSVVTRKLSKYVRMWNPRLLVMSGSFMNRRIEEIQHLLRWCLGDSSPLPKDFFELRAWGYCLDEKVPDALRVAPGALLEISAPDPEDEKAKDEHHLARLRFGRRLLSTRGVIGSTGDLPEIALYARAVKLEPSPDVAGAARHMRHLEETPCGIPMEQPALEIYKHERELSCDFYYRWDVQPPFEWLVARKEWAAWVRDTLKRSRRFDGAMELANAIDRKQIDDGGRLAEWRAVRHLFKEEEHREPVWLADTMTAFCAGWLAQEQGICWVEHVCFGRRLSELTGVPYFGAGGRCRGVSIDQHKGPAIASISAVNEGFNLQTIHNKNLVTTGPSTNLENEQLLSRTHRDGQTADEVDVTYVLMLDADVRALHQARADAMEVEAIMRQPQRLTFAKWLDE